MPFNPDAHQRRSIRLKDYNYAQAGAYFITVCTQHHACLLGDIQDDRVILTDAGRIVAEEWIKTAELRDNVSLDAWVVMPNHFHGILYLSDIRRGTARRAPTSEYFGRPVPGSLPTIIRAFKSATTQRINQWRRTPGARLWQRNYYEHVIRDDADLNRIRQYITDNPLHWALDREHPDNACHHVPIDNPLRPPSP